MDDGHVGAEFLRKSEECENGNGVTRYWQHEGQETRNLSWDITEQYFHDGCFTSIGAEILRHGVQNRFGR